MCNHIYTGNYSQDIPVKCDLGERFSSWAAAVSAPGTPGYFEDPLPVDGDGICLFHSKDLAFKYQNNFARWLDSFFFHSEHTYKPMNVDCREFQVVGDGSSIDLPAWSLREYKSQKGFDLRFWKFYGKLIIENCAFNDVDLSGAWFETEFDFMNNKITRYFTLDDIEAPSVTIEDCRFEISFIANRIKVKNSLSISSNYSHNTFMLLHANVSGEIAAFESNLLDMPYFDDSVFNCNVSFNDTIFNQETFFQRVTFAEQVFFTNITVRNTFLMRGISKESRCFDGQVEWSFKELTGIVKLENVNYFHFGKSTRELFDKLIQQKKVEIGPGCLTYASSISFEVHLLSALHYFCEEIARTFAIYFRLLSGVHLGINVKRISDEKLSVVYFTDEIIDEKKFADKIRTCQQQLKKLIQSSALPVDDNNDPEYYATILDLWAKSKFEFVRAGLALNTRIFDDPEQVITELFKPVHSAISKDKRFYLSKVIEETRRIFPNLNFQIDMSTYNVDINNTNNSQIQVGPGKQIVNVAQATEHIQKTVADLKTEVASLSEFSDKQAAIVYDLLKELEQEGISGAIEKTSFERLRDQLAMAGSASSIGSLLVALSQFIK